MKFINSSVGLCRRDVSNICFQTLERKQIEGSKKQVKRRIFGLDRSQKNRKKK
jgi:hypothetical protein